VPGRTLRCLWLLAVALPALAPAARATDLAGHWKLRQGTVSYEVSHILHEAKGVSTAVSGGADCQAEACRFDFSVPVASFDSKDADRDRDLLAVVQAARFPEARVRGQGRLAAGGQAVLQVTAELAGARVALPPFRVQVRHGWWSLHVQGSFPISLQAFGIARPALLGVPISDTVLIYLDLDFASG
jgi:polyisoprenoid-binding protein YceI